MNRLTTQMLFGVSQRRLFCSQHLMNNIGAAPHIMIDQSVLDAALNLKNSSDESLNLMTIEQEETEWDLKGRNSKTPKKSNHGARPCSSVMRKLKKQGWYKKITSY